MIVLWSNNYDAIFNSVTFYCVKQIPLCGAHKVVIIANKVITILVILLNNIIIRNNQNEMRSKYIKDST